MLSGPISIFFFCLSHSDIRFTASLDEWTTGARAAFDGSGQRLSPRRLRLSVGNVTCEQLHFHMLVRRGRDRFASGPESSGVSKEAKAVKVGQFMWLWILALPPVNSERSFNLQTSDSLSAKG